MPASSIHIHPCTHAQTLRERERESHAHATIMTALSPYAPIGRNAFLVHHPEAVQQRSSRLRRRGAFVLALFFFLIRFKDAPFLPTLMEQIKQSKWSILSQRRATNIWSLLSKLLKVLRTRLQTNSTRNLQQQRGGDNDANADAGTSHAEDKIHTPTSTTSSLPQRDAKQRQRQQTDASAMISVRENRQLIQQILCYWFGQYSPDTSQKKLWMIASSSGQHRIKVDAEITDKFQQVIFDLSSKECCLWKEWVEDTELYGHEGKLAAIVALDQFSRHVRRHHETIATITTTTTTIAASSPTPLVPQTELDALAYHTAQLYTKNHQAEINCGMVPLPMHVFALMPYRHASTLTSVQFVQSCVQHRSTMEEQMSSMLTRFRNATNRRVAVLQDEARRTGATTIATTNNDGILHGNKNCSNSDSCSRDKNEDSDYTNTTSATCKTMSHGSSAEGEDFDILEVSPFDADMAPAKKHLVHSTICSFLASQGIYPNNSTKKKGKDTDNISLMRNNSVIISLSGGVDSMVIAAVLAHLVQDCNYNMHVMAIHIDYGNRPEASAEAHYVGSYCRKLGIAFQCRRIDEVTRGVTARDDYERIAREVRYDSYREAVKECRSNINNVKSSPNDDAPRVGVMLGHHLGDLRENVLSNAHKGCGPLDLSGMTSVSMNDGVLIYRPLLPLEKKEIFDYSHKFGIPYFKDTTPHWSTRGKLRNNLIPLLQDIYGEGSMKNLSTLATESDQARELLHATVLGPFLNQVKYRSMGITFQSAPFKKQGLFFWKFVLREALHSAGLGMFSDKSVISFLERVGANRLRAGWLQCRRDYAVYLEQDGQVFVFFPQSFPFRKAEQYNCKGVVHFGKDNTVNIGPWSISSELISANNVDESESSLALETKAIQSMNAFMNGTVEYHVKVPLMEGKDGSPSKAHPLIFISEYTGVTRPSAWKKSDLKIQSTLPLLGNTGQSLTLVESSGRVYGKDWCLARVTLRNLSGTGTRENTAVTEQDTCPTEANEHNAEEMENI